MPGKTHHNEYARRPDTLANSGHLADNQRWHRSDTSRELWDMAVLWSAAFGEPIEKAALDG
jgi:hypothetical protein